MDSYLVKVSEQFSGVGDVHRFLKTFDRTASVKGWDATKQALMFPAFLTGAADTRYDKIGEEDKKVIRTVKEFFIKQFGKGARNYLREFLSRAFQPEVEDPKSFGLEIEILLNRALPKIDNESKETMLCVKFIDALPIEIQTALEFGEDVKFNDLIERVNNGYKTSKREQTGEIKQEPVDFDVNKVFKYNGRQQPYNASRYKPSEAKGNDQEKPRQNRKFGGVCFKCHRAGHKASECYARNGGQQRSSGQQQAVNKQSDGDSLLKLLEMECSKAEIRNNLIRVDGELVSPYNSRVNLSFMVDTGATHCFINPAALTGEMRAEILKAYKSRDSNYVIQKSSATIKTAKEKETTATFCVPFRLELDGRSFQQNFYLTEIVKTEEVILGRDFLTQNKIMVDNELDKLVFKSPSKNICKLAFDEVIPARTERVVEAKASNDMSLNKVAIFEHFALNNGIISASSLHNVEANKNIHVAVMNITNEDIKLNKHTKLGEIQEVVDVEQGDLDANDQAEEFSVNKLILNDGAALDERVLKLNMGKFKSKQEEIRLKALVSKYIDIFQWTEYSTGRTNLVKHSINTGDHPPIKQVQYRVPQHLREEINKQLEEWLEHGIIRRSSSPWSSNIIMVKKKNGKYRFCIDFRKINEVTIKDAFPLPRIDELIDALAVAEIFSVFDFAHGYWQVEMEEQDKQKTAFMANNNLYEFNVMPFGTCNAPSTFQRMMNTLFSGLTWKYCLVYLDDLLVYSRSFNEHLVQLEEIFSRIKQANLKLQPAKCLFCTNKVNYLGFEISDKGVYPDRGKMKVIEELEPPKNAKETKRFLGMISYYRKFIRQFSSIANPLYELTSKKVKFKWTSQANEAFKYLKKCLMEAPILSFPNFAYGFEIECDASNVGLGAVLIQHIGNENKLIACASRSLIQAERNYSASEKEMLAISWAAKYFETYIFGRKVIFHTDHKPIAQMRDFKDKSGRLVKLYNKITHLNFEIKYKRGAENVRADFLSRLPSGADGGADTKEAKIVEVKKAFDWSEQQDKDEMLARLKERKRGEKVDRGMVDKRWLKYEKYLEIREDGALVKRSRQGLRQVVVPKHLVEKLLKAYHAGNLSGHRSVRKTFLAIDERFFWLNSADDVKQFCSSCDICQRMKYTNQNNIAPLKPIEVNNRFQLVGIDVTGDFPITARKNRYIVVCIDYFTKYAVAEATPDQTATTVARVLFNKIVCQFGAPSSLVSDQGPCFESEVFKQLCQLCGIAKMRTTSYHPQGNGLVERQNRTIKEMIAKYINSNHDNWDLVLDQVMFAYNNSVHESTGYSPFELVYGAKPRVMNDIILKLNEEKIKTGKSEFLKQLVDYQRQLNRIVNDRLDKARAHQKKQYDQNVSKRTEYKVGDWVLVNNYRTRVNHAKKFEPKWTGPARITRIFNNLVFEIDSWFRNKRIKVHYSRIKKYIGEPPKGSQGEPNKSNKKPNPISIKTHPATKTFLYDLIEEDEQSDRTVESTGERENWEDEFEAAVKPYVQSFRRGALEVIDEEDEEEFLDAETNQQQQGNDSEMEDQESAATIQKTRSGRTVKAVEHYQAGVSKK